jgi:hypothetical protein
MVNEGKNERFSQTAKTFSFEMVLNEKKAWLRFALNPVVKLPKEMLDELAELLKQNRPQFLSSRKLVIPVY